MRGQFQAHREAAGVSPPATESKPETDPRLACGGLLKRKEVWTPSARGWLVLCAVTAALFLGFLFGVHPFLAVTSRSQPEVLVIEGWIQDYALLEGWKEFQRGHYTMMLTVGGPFRSGVDLDPDDDYADLAALKLKKMVRQDIPVQAVPSPGGKRDRTYASAIAVKDWLEAHHRVIGSITVVTVGPHARRSRLLYEKAFGSQTAIGVVAIESEDYEQTRWWRYSEGVKEVISEGAAYLYARLFFHPATPP